MYTLTRPLTSADGEEVPILHVHEGTHRPSGADAGGAWISKGELGGLQAVAEEIWPALEIPPRLIEHLISEGSRDLLLGEAPGDWSPIGGVDLASAGRVAADTELFARSVAADAVSAPAARITVLPTEGDHAPVRLCLLIGEEPVGALAFASDAFVLPLPPGTEEIEVAYTTQEEYRHAPTTRPLAPADVQAALKKAVPGGQVSTQLLWRFYIGRESVGLDGLSANRLGALTHTVRRSSFELGGVLTARALFTVHKVLDRDDRDPTAMPRRRRHEKKQGSKSGSPDRPTPAPLPPDIRDITAPAPAVIVAVHGTMACAVPLATFVSETCHCRGVPVVRFEHDTWLPVSRNAEELVAELERLGARGVLFLAHSRGGLVVAEAAERLRQSSRVDHVALLTLGTPFLGTPVVDAARIGVLGTRALLGGLHLLPGTGLVVDAGTRLAGLMIKSRLPQGLADMSPKGSHIGGSSWRELRGATAIAGTVHPTTPGGHYGLRGFSQEAFEGPHDLVVSRESASGRGDERVDVECDHFSYLLDAGLGARVEQHIGRLVGVVDPGRQGSTTDPATTLTW